MEITPEILKSLESDFICTGNSWSGNPDASFVAKFQGKTFRENGKVKIFKNEGAAKSYLKRWVELACRQARYWQRYKGNLEKRHSHLMDFSGLIQYMEPQSDVSIQTFEKKVLALRDELLKQGIITIELVTDLF